MIGRSVDFDRHTVKAKDNPAQVFVQTRPQIVSNQRSTFLRGEHYVIEEVCVRHALRSVARSAGSKWFFNSFRRLAALTSGYHSVALRALGSFNEPRRLLRLRAEHDLNHSSPDGKSRILQGQWATGGGEEGGICHLSFSIGKQWAVEVFSYTPSPTPWSLLMV